MFISCRIKKVIWGIDCLEGKDLIHLNNYIILALGQNPRAFSYLREPPLFFIGNKLKIFKNDAKIVLCYIMITSFISQKGMILTNE